MPQTLQTTSDHHFLNIVSLICGVSVIFLRMETIWSLLNQFVVLDKSKASVSFLMTQCCLLT